MNGSLLHRIFPPCLPLALAASALLVNGYLYLGSHPAPWVQVAELSETLARPAQNLAGIGIVLARHAGYLLIVIIKETATHFEIGQLL